MARQRFAAKWKASKLKESSAAQEHFIDLWSDARRADAGGGRSRRELVLFWARRNKAHSGQGCANVWRRGCFAWGTRVSTRP